MTKFCEGAGDPEECCPRHPSECQCWQVDPDHPSMKAEAMTETELKNCPFCNALPHHGLTKVEHDQLHGEPFQRFRIHCPKGHASVTEATEDQARAAWNTRPATRASVSEAAVTDEMKTGWNSCRRQVYLLAEHEQDKGPYSADESEFARGYKYMAKSFARAFNAFEADDCDFLKEAALSAALASTAETPAETVKPVAWRWAWKTTGSPLERRFADPDLYAWTYSSTEPRNPDKKHIEPLYTRPPARRETWEEALECQPSTAENPNESAYQRGRFDGIMEYSRAIRARATEERDDG